VGGLAILFVVGFYLAIGLWIIVKSPGWWRLVALLAIVLIPTADALWGRYVTLPRLCKDAGLKVYGKASKEGGLMGSSADEYWLTEYDFPFVEGVDGANKVYRRSLRDGKAVLELDVKPQAKYIVSLDELHPSSKVTGAALRIRDATTGNAMGELVDFGFDGGWAERLLSNFSDAGPGPMFRSGCDVGDFSYDRLLAAVFEPRGATFGPDR
jgi:hypothetical protein